MIDLAARLMLFSKDFTGQGDDSFWWFQDGHLQTVDACAIVGFEGIVLCHDFWMIRDALYDATGTLPFRIIDVDEFRISISGVPDDRLIREQCDVTTHLRDYGLELEVCDNYQKMFNKGVPYDETVAGKAAAAIAAMYLDLCEKARIAGESERFFTVEMPVYRELQLAMTSGISIDASRLSEMRSEAEHDYFLALKYYSKRHDMPLETPSRRAIEAKLVLEGFEIDEVSVEYLLEYMPHERDFGVDTLDILALDSARRVLGSLTLATKITRPVIDVFGSRTSRIQLRSPGLQNISKKFRSIFCAGEGRRISYVDFDQFEVGIMAALSADEELKRLYAAGDMYDLFANEHLGLVGKRKTAKQLFLSYAYGMSRKALIDAACSLGAERQKAKRAFSLFGKYEDWKKLVWAEFLETGRVSSLAGNHYRRNRTGQLTGKEQRSAISQVIQGTASLIFKRALIAAASIPDVKIVLPMHDALLFEHSNPAVPPLVVEAFERVMTDVLGGRVNGKASISDFAERVPTPAAMRNS